MSNIPVVDISNGQPTKRKSDWVIPSFDDEDILAPCGQRSSKKPCRRDFDSSIDALSDDLSHKSTITVKADEDLDSWLRKVEPQVCSDLAVNQKKVQEVDQWLQAASEPQNDIGEPWYCCNKIVLLSGPAGTGKTATIRVLAKQRGLQLQEFTLCDVENEYVSRFENSGSYSNIINQIDQFKNFLKENSRCTRSLCLQSPSSSSYHNKLLLFDDLPGGFYLQRKPYIDALSHTIKNFPDCPPIVFIISSTSSNEISPVYTLFPKSVQEDLNIHEIKFLPIATTFMTKALKRLEIVSQFEKHDIDKIIEISAGDIRSAFNSIELAYRHLVLKIPMSRNQRKCLKKDNSVQTFNALGRDICSSFFHIVGKILYAKRSLPPELSSNMLYANPIIGAGMSSNRSVKVLPPLIEDQDLLIGNKGVSSDSLNMYLHQYYIKFATRCETLAKSVDWLSEADCLGASEFFGGKVTGCNEYDAELSVRGLMYNLPANVISLDQGKGKQKKHPTGIISGQVKIIDDQQKRAYRSDDESRPEITSLMSFKKPVFYEVKRACNELDCDLKDALEKDLLPCRPTCNELIIDILPYISRMNGKTQTQIPRALCQRAALDWSHINYVPRPGTSRSYGETLIKEPFGSNDSASKGKDINMRASWSRRAEKTNERTFFTQSNERTRDAGSDIDEDPAEYDIQEID